MNKPHVLIIVQNLSVPYDRRVWLECNSLVENGFDVSVICPRSEGDSKREKLNDVEIYRYAPAPMASSAVSFFIEFAYCFLRTALLSFKIHAKKKIDVVQTCNPPDTYWALGKIFKLVGATFVFDQHDLCPEIFDARFGTNKSAWKKSLRKLLLVFERLNYSTAVKVISTNESYKAIAQDRGKKDENDVVIVRSGPNEDRLYPIDPNKKILGDFEFLLVYIGVMGPQDRVDIAIDAMDEIVNVRGEKRVALALLGDGDCFEELKAQTKKLALNENVVFTGRANDEVIRDYFSSAHLGIAPDPATPFNSHSTHNKIMEYMIFGLPVVAFDLKETKKSASKAVSIVQENADPKAFADRIMELLKDEKTRNEMGKFGRERVLKELVWSHQSPNYVSVIQQALEKSKRFKP